MIRSSLKILLEAKSRLLVSIVTRVQFFPTDQKKFKEAGQGFGSTRSHRNLERCEGVTLLEILVVLVILGLLATLGTRQVMSYLGRSKFDMAQLQVKEIAGAIDLFRLDVGRVPTIQEGLLVLAAKAASATNWRGPYLTKQAVLKDPWGRPWLYGTTDSRQFEVKSLGNDGAPGGEADDADISSSDSQ